MATEQDFVVGGRGDEVGTYWTNQRADDLEFSNGFDPFLDEEDFQHEENYCVHGTFIGNPCGGDYLCGWCEDGTSLEEFRSYCARMENRIIRKNSVHAWFKGVSSITLKDAPFGSITIGIILAMSKHA